MTICHCSAMLISRRGRAPAYLRRGVTREILITAFARGGQPVAGASAATDQTGHLFQ
jgi:hypothetical protein